MIRFVPSLGHNPQAKLRFDDMKGTTGRPGARFGPRGIRAGSSRISADDAWSVYTGLSFLPSHNPRYLT